jgi:hypothetical protein
MTRLGTGGLALFRVLPPAAVLTAAVVALLPGPARASLYYPDDTRMSLQATAVKDKDGRDDVLGQALPFLEFQRRLLILLAAWNPDLRDPKTGAKVVNEARDQVLKQIADRQAVPSRSPEDTVALATLLIRVGRLDDAEGLLARDRQGFLVNNTLAHVYALRHDWDRASEYLSIANGDDPPAGLQKLTKDQLDWHQKLNHGPLARLFKLRLQESQARPKPLPQNEDVDDLFRVRFVNEVGKYEPGKLAPAERAKLPPDAIAMVQQLLFWFPTDTRLYWLLAELYAADGDFISARFIMNVCVDLKGRQYGNRRILAAHWAVVDPLGEEQKKKQPAEEPLVAPQPPPAEKTEPKADAAPPAEPKPEQPPTPIGLGAIWVYFGLVGAVAVLAAVRLLTRRGKGNRGLAR